MLTTPRLGVGLLGSVLPAAPRSPGPNVCLLLAPGWRVFSHDFSKSSFCSFLSPPRNPRNESVGCSRDLRGLLSEPGAAVVAVNVFLFRDSCRFPLVPFQLAGPIFPSNVFFVSVTVCFRSAWFFVPGSNSAQVPPGSSRPLTCGERPQDRDFESSARRITHLLPSGGFFCLALSFESPVLAFCWTSCLYELDKTASCPSRSWERSLLCM